MDHLRQGIGLRGYAQKDPKQEYKREAFALFEALLETVKFEIVGLLSKVQFRSEEELAQMEAERERQQMQFEHPTLNAESAAEAAGQYATREAPEKPAEPVVKGADETYVRQGQKIGRNEPCPCGSGKKYKKCHGQLN
jgi:preprotein translocase subunit SecA